MTRTTSHGFTLIEVMVAVAIFTIIVISGVGAMLTSSDGYRRSRTRGSAIDNLEFAIETMTRRLRTGHSFSCSPVTDSLDCESGSKILRFVDQDGQPTTYRLVSNSQGGYIERRVVVAQGVDGCTASSGCERIEQVTRPGSVILRDEPIFFLRGSSPSDDMQPYVVVRVEGVANFRGEEQSFSLQTTATQRLLDLPPVEEVVTP